MTVTKPAMVLPPLDDSGYVDAHPFDERVPRLGEDRARPAGGRNYLPGVCPRHLFDALEAIGPDRYDEHDELVPNDFRLVLTCIHCGTVVKRAGRMDESAWRDRRLDPTPIRSGCLVAQQISPGPHIALWSIYRNDAPVGLIQQRVTRRGREYFTARLDGGPDAEGPTAAAALRKLAKLPAAVTA